MTGYSFTFVISTENGIHSVILHRSVIRKRNLNSHDPYGDYAIGNSTINENTENGMELETCVIDDDDTGEDTMQVGGDTDHREFNLGNDQEYDEIIMSTNPNHDNLTVITHVEKGDELDHQTAEVYDHFDKDLRCGSVSDIIGSKFSEDDGKLYMLVRWEDGQETYIDTLSLRCDDLHRLAQYIQANPVERLRSGLWSTWAAQTMHSISKVGLRVHRIYHVADIRDNIYPYIRRVIRRKKVHPIKMQSFLGIEIPRNTKEALLLDEKNKDGMWKAAMKVEIDGIKDHGTFLFLPPGAEPPEVIKKHHLE
jgi:hypothetical protein